MTPWIVARQAPLFMGYSSQEYWRGLPRPTLGDLPDPGMEPTSLLSSTLAGGFFATSATREAPPVSRPCTTSLRAGNREKTPPASGTPSPEDGSEIFTIEKGAGQILIQYRTVKS